MENKIKNENNAEFRNGLVGRKFSFGGEEYYITSVRMEAKLAATAAVATAKRLRLKKKEAQQANKGCCIYLCGAKSGSVETNCIVVKEKMREEIVYAGDISTAGAEFARLYSEIYADPRNLERH